MSVTDRPFGGGSRFAPPPGQMTPALRSAAVIAALIPALGCDSTSTAITAGSDKTYWFARTEDLVGLEVE